MTDEPEPPVGPAQPDPAGQFELIENWARRKSLTDRRAELLSAFVTRMVAEHASIAPAHVFDTRYAAFCTAPA